MAFDPKPSSWISSWSEDGTSVTFDIGDVDNFNAALADATTGDWRSCISALLAHTLTYYNSLAGADKPAKTMLTSSYFVDTDGTIWNNMSLSIALSPSTIVALPDSE